jgi:hypothetical protein
MLGVAARRLGCALGSYVVFGVARIVGAITGSWVTQELIGMNPKGSNRAAASCETAGSIFTFDAAGFTAGITGREGARGT